MRAAKEVALDEAERIAGKTVSAFIIGVAVEAAARVLLAVPVEHRQVLGEPDAEAA